jgi:guanylate kinase
VAAAVVGKVPSLWLSRSWTTRRRRAGEAADAYRFVDRSAFEAHVEEDRFLEWAEVFGELYGTPVPDPPPGRAVLLEIDVQGAAQVRKRHPEAVVILLLPPSRAAQEERLRGRGDEDATVARRLAGAEREEREGRALAHHVVVNDDLSRAADEVAAIVECHLSERGEGL